jgi:hypothetical protein
MSETLDHSVCLCKRFDAGLSYDRSTDRWPAMHGRKSGEHLLGATESETWVSLPAVFQKYVHSKSVPDLPKGDGLPIRLPADAISLAVVAPRIVDRRRRLYLPPRFLSESMASPTNLHILFDRVKIRDSCAQPSRNRLAGNDRPGTPLSAPRLAGLGPRATREKASDGELDGGQGYEGGERFGEGLVVLGQTAVAANQEKVRSTTQRRGSTTKPLVSSERLTISSRSPGNLATASLT